MLTVQTRMNFVYSYVTAGQQERVQLAWRVHDCVKPCRRPPSVQCRLSVLLWAVRQVDLGSLATHWSPTASTRRWFVAGRTQLCVLSRWSTCQTARQSGRQRQVYICRDFSTNCFRFGPVNFVDFSQISMHYALLLPFLVLHSSLHSKWLKNFSRLLSYIICFSAYRTY